MVGQEPQAKAVRLLVLLRAVHCTILRTRRELNTTARCMHCDGSLLSPLHLAIIGNEFLMMFLPAAMWTRTVGLRGLSFNYALLTYILSINWGKYFNKKILVNK